MLPHSENKEELIKAYQTDKEKGLEPEAIRKLLSQHGENRLREKRKKTNLERFADQFKDVMIIILLAAAAVSFGIAIHEGEAREFFEPILILIIVIINAVMGVMQESKAEKALDALKSLSAPHARVIRGGVEQVIDAAQLVPGDIIKLEAGDFVPADARLISSASLKSEESALTGESVASEKDAEAEVAPDAPIGDRTNMVFSGCSITYGTGVAMVTSTGMNTEVGKIADLLDNEEDDTTPLQKKLAGLGKILGIAALIACGVIFFVGIMDGMPVMEIFMVAVSLAVSAIPEGLPAIVTIVLSIGVQRMVKKNAIIRRLPAVETLGSASVICSDKTGTLTQNSMTLVEAYSEKDYITEEISETNGEEIRRLIKFAALCCNGSVVVEGESVKHIGDPTETSIVYAAMKNGMPKEKLFEQNPRLGEIPFDSDRKLMTTVNLIDGEYYSITKGAFDMLSARCVEGDLERAKELCDSMSERALRVIAVAFKKLPGKPEKMDQDSLEHDLSFMGLVGMIDPPREEAKEAVSLCRKAGIKPVMITGDHVVTARAIAQQIGIYMDGDEAITGAELDAMSDEELFARVRKISVYARVSPEYKIRIVKAWRNLGEVVSMTGDGVNDAPALKAADIGCAMGIT
ncbi:MAG: HAD-IC family P-type ATPase, partial [Firmicutes bacterium]|nr:HAD-IC family P-type ATPase [Bacillota bacterium]